MNQETELSRAVGTLIQALKDDPEYLWGWQSNIAMSMYDAGCGDALLCNEGAARFLELFADVDPRKLPYYPTE